MNEHIRINNLTETQVVKYTEIIQALIRCGGLSGVKRGKTIIHFDEQGNFQGVQLDYWPWKKRKNLTEIEK